MVKKKGRKTLFMVLTVIGILLLIISVVVVAKSLSSNKSSENDTTGKEAPAITDESRDTEKPAETTPKETPDEVAIDTAKVSTITIDPMSITVSYMKGIGGFDYLVSRTASGTKYVQFSSPKLVGTKCTNDEGVFASIIETPSADETATLAKTTTVEGTTYGLSLSDSTCTSNAELLKHYQDSFSEPFSLLKKM